MIMKHLDKNMAQRRDRFCSMIAMLIPLVMLVAAKVDAEPNLAYDIMKKVDERFEGDTSTAQSAMVLIDKKGRKRTRMLKQYAKSIEGGTKYMARFETPADLTGTVYINYDWDGIKKSDESWLYLPSLKKSKRLAGEDRSGAFLGSDFSYADISGFEFDWYQYQLIAEEEEVDGQPCWVIEYSPKPEYEKTVYDNTGDMKVKTWVRKDNYMQVKSIIWKKKGKRVKYYTAKDIEKIDGVWTAKKMQMITTRNNKKEHASVFIIQDIKYGDSLTDTIFSPNNMGRITALL